ncbi:MAG TPA: flagellar hook-length control protein FliK [Acidobacteriaceae bacterium]|nr:flagellar hook-length control protein FliK [Acidobacteriaceae bacterium]
MDRLQSENVNSLPGSAPRLAATNLYPAFSELMLRQATPATVPANSAANAAQTVAERREVRAEYPGESASTGTAEETSQASESPGEISNLRAAQVEAQSLTGSARANEESSGLTAVSPVRPSVPLPLAAKTATAPLARKPGGSAQPAAVSAAKSEKVTNRARSDTPAPQRATTRLVSTSAAVPAGGAKNAGFSEKSAKAQRNEMTAPGPGPQASVAAPEAPRAAKAIPLPPRPTGSATAAPSATSAASSGPRNGSGGTMPGVEAKNGADSAPARAADAATSHTNHAGQQVSADALRAATSTVTSPANAAGRTAAAISQPAMPEAPNVTGAVSPLAHVLRMSPAGLSPASSSNGSPATVSAAFTRMDSAAPPQVLESAPQRLSVGVRDSGLGWVEIRTHATAGQVSAVLATGSSEAHAALQAHLPELRDYLAGQQVRVDQLASERFSSSGGSGEPAQQQPNRSGSSGDPETQGMGPPVSAAFSEGAEDGLSYINVRV